jgi:hypothetical protein
MIDTISQYLPILRREMAEYAQPFAGGTSSLTENETHDLFKVTDIFTHKGKRESNDNLVVRIHHNFIVIERDMNDKTLVDALVQSGVPRDRIVLTYAHESLEKRVAEDEKYALYNGIRMLMESYLRSDDGSKSWLAASDDHTFLALHHVYSKQGTRKVETALVVRLIGKQIVIEHDINDKVLVEALVQAGIPRDKIILAYAGEPLPEEA